MKKTLPDESTLRLAVKIADDTARSAVECNCVPADDERPHRAFFVPSVAEGRPRWLMDMIRYCTLRGFATRYGCLVTFKTARSA